MESFDKWINWFSNSVSFFIRVLSQQDGFASIETSLSKNFCRHLFRCLQWLPHFFACPRLPRRFTLVLIVAGKWLRVPQSIIVSSPISSFTMRTPILLVLFYSQISAADIPLEVLNQLGGLHQVGVNEQEAFNIVKEESAKLGISFAQHYDNCLGNNSCSTFVDR